MARWGGTRPDAFDPQQEDAADSAAGKEASLHGNNVRYGRILTARAPDLLPNLWEVRNPWMARARGVSTSLVWAKSTLPPTPDLP